jgi:hypothetical protein
MFGASAFRLLGTVSPFRCNCREALLDRRLLERRAAGKSLSAIPVMVSCVRLFRFTRRGDLGSDVVMLLLVALKKLEFAALRKGVGRERRSRWEYGIAVTGSGSCVDPMAES